MKTISFHLARTAAVMTIVMPLGITGCDSDWPESEIDRGAEELRQETEELQEELAVDWDAVPTNPDIDVPGTRFSDNEPSYDDSDFDTADKRSSFVSAMAQRLGELEAEMKSEMEKLGDAADRKTKDLANEWRGLKRDADNALERLRAEKPTRFDDGAESLKRSVDELERELRDFKVRINADA